MTMIKDNKFLFLLTVICLLFFIESCTTTTKDVARSKALSVQPLKAEKPSYKLDYEYEEYRRQYEKALDFLNSIVVGKERLLKKKMLFPNVRIVVLEQTDVNSFLEQLSNISGYRIINRSNRTFDFDKAMTYDYINLIDILYEISNRLNCEIEFNYQLKTFYLTNRVRKIYYLPIINGRESLSVQNTPSSLGEIGASVGGSSNSGSTSAEESGRFRFQIDNRDVLMQTVNALRHTLGEGSIVTYDQVSNQIIVETDARLINLADQLIKKTIKELSRQIDVYVSIVEVSWTSEKSRSQFFDYLREKASKTYHLTVGSNTANISSNVVTFSFSKVNPSYVINTILNMSSVYGSSRVVANTRALVQNSYPVTLFSGRIIEYVQSTIITFQQDRQVITPVTARVSDGLSVHVIPKILDDDKILFIIVPRISSVTFTDYSYSNQTVRLPSSRVHQQYVRFVSRDGTTSIFGAVTYSTINDSENSAEPLSLFRIKASESQRAERRDLLFIIYGKIVDLSGDYIYD